jgi:hypothetical protein
MEATTTRRRRDARPRSYYQNLVKDMDESEKLELVSIIIDSLKPTVAPQPLRRYTKAEMNAMLDEAEANFAAGRGIPDEEAWDDLEEELALEKQEPKMAETV